MTVLEFARAVYALAPYPVVVYCHKYDLERVKLGIEQTTAIFDLPPVRVEIWSGSSPGFVLILPDRVPRPVGQD